MRPIVSEPVPATRRKARHPVVLLSFALALIVAACGGDSGDDTTTTVAPGSETTTTAGTDTTAPPEQIEPVTIQMVLGTGIPDVHAAELYVAQDKGWFEAASITVEEVIMDGSVAAMSALAAGQGNMSVLLSAGLPGVALAGEDIVSFYHSGYSPLFVLVYPVDGRVQSFEDFASISDGKLGVASLASAAVPIAQFGVRNAGVELDTVEFLPIGFGAEAVTNLTTGGVDAAIWTLWNLPLLDEIGFEYGYKVFEDLQDNWVGQIMASSPQKLQEDRDALVRFAQVWTHTRKYCLEDVEGCADSFIRATGDENPRDVVIEQIELRNTIMVPPPAANGLFGYTERSFWETLVNVQLEAEWIEGEPDIDSLFTTEFVQEVNEPPPGITE